MHGLMMDRPLLVSALLEHAERFHPEREVVSATFEGGLHRSTWGELASRARRLAAALTALGVRPGDRVATVALNTHRHLEAYYAISGMGAVCHTVNPRLAPDQMAYVLEHAGDVAVLFDPPFAPLVTALSSETPALRHPVVLASRARPDGRAGSSEVLAYEDLLSGAPDGFSWPELDERAASGLWYTSGTTGHPKGVLYSPRS